MRHEATRDRRSVVVAAVLGTAGLGTLGACGGGSGSASSTTVSSTSVPPSSVSTPAGGGGVGSGGASPSSPAGAPVASLVALDRVPVGGSVVVAGPSGKVAVAQPTAGQVVAFSAICTHQGCTVAAAGEQLQCPCHGSAFDAFTGAAVKGPATSPLGKVDVSVSGQDVVAG